MKKGLSRGDEELISGYLDHEISLIESTRFEERMERDSQLREAVNEVRQTRRMLRTLPLRHAPRAFTLSPEMAINYPRSRRSLFSMPLSRTFQFGAALSAVLLIFVIGGDLFSANRMGRPAAVVAPMSSAAEGLEMENAALEMDLQAAEPELPSGAAQPAAAPVIPATAPWQPVATEAVLMRKLAEDEGAKDESVPPQAPAPQAALSYAAEEATGLDTPRAAAASLPDAEGAPVADEAESFLGAEQISPATAPAGEMTPVLPPVAASITGQPAAGAGSIAEPAASTEKEKPPARWGWRFVEGFLVLMLVGCLTAAWWVSRGKQNRF